jgi:uncharacterized protein YicC (UPF0701 family)
VSPDIKKRKQEKIMAQSATNPRARKPWLGAIELVQDQVKSVEKIWSDTVDQLHTRVQGVEEDARQFVKRVETDGRERIDEFKGQFDGARVNGDLLNQGARLRQETVERLGLITTGDLTLLGTRVDKIATRLDTVRRKANTVTQAKKEITLLKRRTTSLEKRLEMVTAEVADLKKAKTLADKKVSAKK